MKRKPLMLVGMPSCGTDWFAACLAEHTRLNYVREYFNPMCDWSKADDLTAAGFASESPLSIGNLTKEADPEKLAELVARFGKDGYTMTKEIWSQAKYHQLSEHFDLVALARREQDTFMPTRARVMCWFQQVAVELGCADGTFEEAARAGFRGLSAMHLNALIENSIPTVWWHDLVNKSGNKLIATLEPLSNVLPNVSRLAEIVTESRKPREEATTA